ncbi:hypothetical protein HHX47_DHR5000006 [Lentinula edodes]|nr:hypothetical protein HHX47_DHR5000006 [Lentinula edodes]
MGDRMKTLASSGIMSNKTQSLRSVNPDVHITTTPTPPNFRHCHRQMVDTRRSITQQKEQRPRPCRSTEEHENEEEDILSNSSLRAGASKNGSRSGYRESQKIDISWFDKARLRVIAAAVCGFRCLLTLEPGLSNKDLNFVHFLARTTSLPVLLCLEYSWGLYPGHLNVNFYLNIDIMRVDLHHSFDAGIFFFLPALLVLEKMLEFTRYNVSKKRTRDKKKFYQEFSDATWTYDLYTVTFDPHRSIHRRNIDTTIRIPDDITRHPDKGGYTEHDFPFNNMRNLISHVQPFFVVANAYLHMHKLARVKRIALMAENDSLQLVWQIGEIWLKPVPVSFKDTRKGGENEMADPETDTVSFLADKDSHADVKYQQKQVFYRRMLGWADEQRASENVFSKTVPLPITLSDKKMDNIEMEDASNHQNPTSTPARKIRTRSSTISERKCPTSAKRTLNEKEDREDVRISKKGRLTKPSQGFPSTPSTPRKSRYSNRNRNAVETIDLEPEISAYPSLAFEVQVADGQDFLLDFISSQIAALRHDSRVDCDAKLSSNKDDNEIADIAFRVLENQTADGEIAGDFLWESDTKTTPGTTSKSRLSISKTPSSTKKTPLRKRSSTLVLAHVEIPVENPTPSTPSQIQKVRNTSNTRSMTLDTLRSDSDTYTETTTPIRGRSVAPATAPRSSSNAKKLIDIRARSVLPLSTRSMRISSSLNAITTKITTSPSLDMSANEAEPMRGNHPNTVNSDANDQSTFIHIGRQIMFERLAQEFGKTVDEISGIYSDLGNLDNTRKVLVRLSGIGTPLGPQTSSSLGHSASRSDVSNFLPGSRQESLSVASSVKSNRNVLARSQSVAPPSRSPSLYSSTASPSFLSIPTRNESRSFLTHPQPWSPSISSLISPSPSIASFSKLRHVNNSENDSSGSRNSADESDVLLERKKRSMQKRSTKKKRKTVNESSSLIQASTSSSSSSAQSLRKTNLTSTEREIKNDTEAEKARNLGIATSEQQYEGSHVYMHEHRLDSLARSIELILRNGK